MALIQMDLPETIGVIQSKMIEVESITFADQSISIETTYSGNANSLGAQPQAPPLMAPMVTTLLTPVVVVTPLMGAQVMILCSYLLINLPLTSPVNGDTITLTGNSSEGLA